MKTYKDDIPYQVAYDAHRGTSFVPDERAEQQQVAYVEHLQAIQNDLTKHAKSVDDLKRVTDLIEMYRQGYSKRLIDYLRSRSRVMSVMIAGPSNFPVSRNEKANRAADKKLDELMKWSAKVQKSMLREFGVGASSAISSDDPQAIQQLQEKLDKLDEGHKKMIDANKIARKKIDEKEKISQLVQLGFSSKMATELLHPDWGKPGFASYALNNNRAEAKRIQGRIQNIETRRSQSTQKATFDGGYIIDNVEENRLQIYFDQKPDRDMIQNLKHRGFKWSPTRGAWQRMRGSNAIYALKALIPDYKMEKPEPEHSADTEDTYIQPKVINDNADKVQAEKKRHEETPDSSSVDQKQPWEMTRQEFQDAVLRKNPLERVNLPDWNEAHKKSVKKAYESGKKVPIEVLDDYPELIEGDYIGVTEFTKRMKTIDDKQTAIADRRLELQKKLDASKYRNIPKSTDAKLKKLNLESSLERQLKDIEDELGDIIQERLDLRTRYQVEAFAYDQGEREGEPKKRKADSGPGTTSGGGIQPPEKPHQKPRKPKREKPKGEGNKISTGRIISTYQRPELQEVDITPEDLERQMKEPNTERLSLNMWQIGRYQSPVNRNAWLTMIVIKKDGKYYKTEIPTAKDGTINQLTMAERLLDSEDGDRQNHNRNVLIDCSVDALKVYKPEQRAETYRWFLHPNETDVLNIDDSNSKLVEITGSGTGIGGAGGSGRRIKALIVGGTASDRETIANHIRYNFTIRERQIINNCLIEIAANTRKYAGCFMGETDFNGNIIGTPRIVITKNHVKNADVTVHEAIHALRKFDSKRLPELKAVKNYWRGSEADVEESLTEAETTGRENPFSRGQHYSAGYYHYIKIPNKDSKTLVIEDRVTITNDNINKGQKGKRVQKTILLKYPQLNISKLKNKGRSEAIDTFYEINRQLPGGGGHGRTGQVKTEAHFYNPDGTKETDKAIDEQLKSETSGEIFQATDTGVDIIQTSRTKNTGPVVSAGKIRLNKKVQGDFITGTNTIAEPGNYTPYIYQSGQVAVRASNGNLINIKDSDYNWIEKPKAVPSKNKTKPKENEFKRPSQRNSKKTTSSRRTSSGSKFGPYKYRGGRLSK